MISDDELLLYYYRDGLDGAERARIAAVLAGDPAVARRLHTLVARLDAAAALPEVPVPAQVQRRWQAALERATQAAGSEAARVVRTGPLPGARWLAAAAAVVAIAVVVTLQLSPPPQDRVTREAPPDATPATPSAYERGLRSHLASTEQQLASLERATPEERARLVEAIIAQNRMYALAAERAGEPQLARVLRAFAPVLETVAREGGASTESGIAQLGFELRVLQGRLGAGSDTPSNAQPMAL